MKTFYSFETVEDFEKFLQTKDWKSGELDYVTVGGIVYTMHEYDSDGKTMSWGNKKHDTLVECNTANRYGAHGFSDAKLYLFENWGMWRNDISYHE